MNAVGVFFIYTLIIFMELPPLWKDKKKKYVLVYLVFMMGSLIICICLVSGVELPVISSVFTKIFSGQ